MADFAAGREQESLMDFEEFKTLLRQSDPDHFARHRLFDEGCWVFQSDTIKSRGNYAEFRGEIADFLEINPRSVAIIGSAKFGWSMSPEKIGNQFNLDKSDIDIVIVSSNLFEDIWHQILRAYYNGYSNLRKSHSKEIFAKFVIVKSDLDSKSDFLRDLRRRLLGLNGIVNRFLSIEDRARYRIYRDWSDVELYHARGLSEFQEAIRE